MQNDFTPLSHEELKTRWDLAEHLPQFVDERRLILTAIWWESLYRDRTFQFLLREIGIEWKED